MAASQRRAKAIDYRACPKGAKRGVDVARMYTEIAKLVRAKYAGGVDVDVEDLVQETAAAIATRNGSAASAFDPARAGFAHYVHLVASNKLGHMRGSQIRRDRPVTLPGDEALAALEDGELAAAAPVGEPDARTVGELVERLEDVADAAREAAREIRRRRGPEAEARYQDGVLATARSVAELLGLAFDEDAVVAVPPKRARASSPAADVGEQLGASVPELLYGWGTIGARLGVSTATARGFALRERDPLPAEVDHQGVCIELAALEAWRARQRAPYVAPRAA